MARRRHILSQQQAFRADLDRRRVADQRPAEVRVRYCGVPLGLYRLDLLREDEVVVEIKAVATIETVHLAMALAYLEATDLQVGMIVNFGSSIMQSRRVFRDVLMEKEGQKTGIRERQVLAASPRVAAASNAQGVTARRSSAPRRGEHDKSSRSRA